MMHALLRLALLGFNILDTFKSLKVKPHPGHGPRSAKALTQHKRGMKGVLCLWVVCMSFFICESIGDRTVGYVTPFYGQMKTLVLLFLVFARTAGAEFIVLHVIGPFIKPYTKIIDSVLDFIFVLATFAVELCMVPWNSLMARWDEFNAAKEPSTRPQVSTDDSGLAITSTEVTPVQTRNHSRMDIPVQDLPMGYNVADATANGHATRSQLRRSEENPLQVPTIRVQRSTRSLGSNRQHPSDRDLPGNASTHEFDDEAVTMQTRRRRDLDAQEAVTHPSMRQARGIINDIARAQNEVREATEARRRLQARSNERMNASGRSRFGSGPDKQAGYTSSSSSLRRLETLSNSEETTHSADTIQGPRYGQRATQSSHSRMMPSESFDPKPRPPSDSSSSRGPFISYVPAPPAGTVEYSNSIGRSRPQSEHSFDDASEAPSEPTISYLETETPPHPPYIALQPPNHLTTPVSKSQASSAPSIAAASLLPSEPLPSAQTSTFTAFATTIPMQSSSHTSTSMPTGFDVSQLDIDSYFNKFGSMPGGLRDSTATDNWEGLTQLSLVNKSPAVPQPQPLFTLLGSTNGGSVTSEPPEVPPKDHISAGSSDRTSSSFKKQHIAQRHSVSSSATEPLSPSYFPPPTPPSQYLRETNLPDEESPYPPSLPQQVVELPDESADFRTSASRHLSMRDSMSPGPLAPGGFQWSFSQPLSPLGQRPSEKEFIPESRRTTVQDFDDLKQQYDAGMLDSPRSHPPGHFPSTPAGLKVSSPLTPDGATLGVPHDNRSPRKVKKKPSRSAEPKDILRSRMMDITSTLASHNGVSLPAEDDEAEEDWRNSQRISIFDPPTEEVGEFGENDTFNIMKNGSAMNGSESKRESNSKTLPVMGSPPGKWLTDVIESTFSTQTKSAITQTHRLDDSAQPISPRGHRYQPTAISAAAMMMDGSPPTQAILRPIGRSRGDGSGSAQSPASREALYLEDQAHSISESLSPTLADNMLRGPGARLTKSRPPPIMTEQAASAKRGETIPVSGSSSASARNKNGNLTRNGSVSGRSDAASSRGSASGEKGLAARSRSSKRALREDQNRYDATDDADDDSQSDSASVTKKRKVARSRVPASSHPSISAPSQIAASQIPSYSRTSGSSGHRSRSSKEAVAPPPALVPPPLPARNRRNLPEPGSSHIPTARSYPTIDPVDMRSSMNEEALGPEPPKSSKSKRHRK